MGDNRKMLIENYVNTCLNSEICGPSDIFGYEGNSNGDFALLGLSHLTLHGYVAAFPVTSGDVLFQSTSPACPVARLPALMKALSQHPSIEQFDEIPAFWTFLMLFVKQWAGNDLNATADGFTKFCMLNEMAARFAAFHGGNYFGSSNQPGHAKNLTFGDVFPRLSRSPRAASLSQIPITVHRYYRLVYLDEKQTSDLLVALKYIMPEYDDAMAKGNDENREERTFANGQLIEFKKARVADNSLSSLSERMLMKFAASEMMLLNTKNGRGFSYATIDDGVLTFTECKLSFLGIDGIFFTNLLTLL